MIEKKYRLVFGQILFLVLVLLMNNACSNQERDKGFNFSSVQYKNELIMYQTDDKFGEWGGDTYFVRLYRHNQSKELMVDYTKYQGYAGPPSPPDPNAKEQMNLFSGQPIEFERKNIVASNQLLSLVSKSIQELMSARLNNDKYVVMFGISNHVMCSDSTLWIRDYPSISWDKFHELINEIEKD